MASAPPPNRPRLLDWLPALSAAALLVGAAVTYGGVLQEVSDALRRLNVVEAREDARDKDRMTDVEKLNAIDVRTARIESKIDVLAPGKDFKR